MSPPHDELAHPHDGRMKAQLIRDADAEPQSRCECGELGQCRRVAAASGFSISRWHPAVAQARAAVHVMRRRRADDGRARAATTAPPRATRRPWRPLPRRQPRHAARSWSTDGDVLDAQRFGIAKMAAADRAARRRSAGASRRDQIPLQRRAARNRRRGAAAEDVVEMFRRQARARPDRPHVRRGERSLPARRPARRRASDGERRCSAPTRYAPGTASSRPTARSASTHLPDELGELARARAKSSSPGHPRCDRG